MKYNLQGKTWEGASELPQPRTAPSLTLVQKAGQRGRAHCAFGLASNNRNGFLICKLKRELGTRVHIVRCDMTLACGCSRLGVKEIPTILEKAELFGASHAFHVVQLLLDRFGCLFRSLRGIYPVALSTAVEQHHWTRLR